MKTILNSKLKQKQDTEVSIKLKQKPDIEITSKFKPKQQQEIEINCLSQISRSKARCDKCLTELGMVLQLLVDLRKSFAHNTCACEEIKKDIENEARLVEELGARVDALNEEMISKFSEPIVSEFSLVKLTSERKEYRVAEQMQEDGLSYGGSSAYFSICSSEVSVQEIFAPSSRFDVTRSALMTCGKFETIPEDSTSLVPEN